MCNNVWAIDPVDTPSSNKVWTSADEAIADIADGSKLIVGGFGLCGIPEVMRRSNPNHGNRTRSAPPGHTRLR